MMIMIPPKGGTIVIISKRQLFFSLFICGFVIGGCEVGHLDEQGNGAGSATISVSGLAYYDATPIADAQVLLGSVEDADLYFTTMTDEHGRFALSIDQAGEYELFINRTAEGGSYDKQYVVTIESGVMTYDIGEIEVEFYPLGSTNLELAQMVEMEYNDDESSDDGFATITGELWSFVSLACAGAVASYAYQQSKPDSWKHCYSSCAIRKTCGISASGTSLLGLLKELCDLLSKGNLKVANKSFCQDPEPADILSNNKGINCSYAWWKSCSSCCN